MNEHPEPFVDPSIGDVEELQKRVRSTIEGVTDLPTLPGVVMKVVQLAADENVSARQLKEVIVTDPPLSAKVLKAANSAFFARREKTENLDQAIVTIGLNELINLCVSTGMIETLESWEEKQLHRADIWKHSLATAFLAKSLGLRKDMQRPGSPDLFLCGLLHNIGWIVIDQFFRSELKALLKTAAEVGEWRLEYEQRYLGLNHAEIGALFLRKWGLPDAIAHVIEYHHTPDNTKEHAAEAALIGLAATLSPFEFFPNIHVNTISDHIPHLLQHTEGEAAIREMRQRYEANIKQAKVMTERMMSWL
ncbi:MAG: HDOD domain-containing protein [bacterium]